MSTSAAGSSFFSALYRRFSSKPPVHVKTVTSHDAKPGDPVWFDVENTCGQEVAKISIECANAFRNPAGLSFFRFNALQELPPETFENVLPGSNRRCSHYRIPKNKEDKVYSGFF